MSRRRSHHEQERIGYCQGNGHAEVVKDVEGKTSPRETGVWHLFLGVDLSDDGPQDRAARSQTVLKLIGYWRGSDEDEAWPHPAAFVRPGWRMDERPKIVAYLRGGVRIHEDLGYSHCRFEDGPPPKQMGNAELTDGVWVWPEGLWVYVARYSVALPEDFINHMSRNAFRISPDLDASALEDEDVDLEFWKGWCRNHE